MSDLKTFHYSFLKGVHFNPALTFSGKKNGVSVAKRHVRREYTFPWRVAHSIASDQISLFWNKILPLQKRNAIDDVFAFINECNSIKRS